MMVTLDRKVLKDHRVLKVHKELMVLKVHKVLLVLKVLKVHKDQLVQLAQVFLF